MKKIMTNKDIYIAFQNLIENFMNTDTIMFPVLVNYSIQKNLKVLRELCEPIEMARNAIGVKYGEVEKSTPLKSPKVYNIRMIKLSELKDLSLTFGQMQALLFMIEEEI